MRVREREREREQKDKRGMDKGVSVIQACYKRHTIFSAW